MDNSSDKIQRLADFIDKRMIYSMYKIQSGGTTLSKLTIVNIFLLLLVIFMIITTIIKYFNSNKIFSKDYPQIINYNYYLIPNYEKIYNRNKLLENNDKKLLL